MDRVNEVVQANIRLASRIEELEGRQPALERLGAERLATAIADGEASQALCEALMAWVSAMPTEIAKDERLRLWWSQIPMAQGGLAASK